MALLKIAPQRGHAVALAEIMAREADLPDDVLLFLLRPSRHAHAGASTVFILSCDANSAESRPIAALRLSREAT